MTDVLAVRRRALSLVARHPLRAAEAAQLGAVLLVAPESGPTLDFVCLDDRLAEASEREGLNVLLVVCSTRRLLGRLGEVGGIELASRQVSASARGVAGPAATIRSRVQPHSALLRSGGRQHPRALG